MVISHRAPAQCKFFTSHQSRVTSHEIQLYFSRGRKGSGDLPGLQSRRFGPSRVEWWIRLPHASATFMQCLCMGSVSSHVQEPRVNSCREGPFQKIVLTQRGIDKE